LKQWFHVGTANPRKKMITAEMQNELIQLMQEGKIVEEVVSKESTIANLTTFFLRSWNMQ